MKLNKKSIRDIVYALGINYSIYILLHLFFFTTYESQLDIMMQAAVQGVSGTKTASILYSNVILGWIIKGFTIEISFINWYYVYLVFMVIVSLSIISYIMILRTGRKMGTTVSVILASFIGYECYILPGYMKSASVLGMAALVLLADTIGRSALNSKKRKWGIIVLIVLCSMVSMSVFMITLLLGIVGLIVYDGSQHGWVFFSWLRKDGKFVKEQVKPLAFIAVGMIAGVILLRGIDVVSYHVRGYENSAKYRSAVIRMYGYGMGDYDPSYTEKYGIDSAEYDSIKKGSFGVTGESTWKTLKKLSKEHEKISFKVVNMYFKSVPLKWFKYGTFYLFLIMLFLLSYAPSRKKKVTVWTQIILLFITFFVLYVCHAWWNNWIVFVAVLPLILPMLLAQKDAPEKEYRYLCAYLVVMSVILYGKFSSGMVSGVSSGDMSEKFVALTTEQKNIIDLNAYLKSYSAQKNYTRGILKANNVVVSNGAYALMEGFEDDVMTAYPSENEKYEWIYNTKDLSIWNMVFEKEWHDDKEFDYRK